MKRYRKDHVKLNDLSRNFDLAQKVMFRIEHPFIQKLEYFFKTDKRYYQFTRFMHGFSLADQNILKNGFDIYEIQGVAMQLVLAIEELHKNSFVHRNINASDVLVDESGYIKLAGFGYANDMRESESDKNTKISALKYCPPELIEKSKHAYGPQVDWWGLGILLYELYYQRTPFEKEEDSDTILAIQEFSVEFPDLNDRIIPKRMKKFKSLINGLLEKDPTKRLGYSENYNGAKIVKKAKFFKNADFNEMYDKQMNYPFDPILKLDKIRKLLKKKKYHVKIGELRNSSHSRVSQLQETDI
jgi:serine/threonine protein kinase